MGVSLRIQDMTSNGTMFQATLLDNIVSANHSQLMMAKSPLMCSIRKESLCGPSSFSNVMQFVGGFT